MKQNTILVIDTGSSSMRGLLYTQGGALLFTKQLTYFMEVSDNLTAQQDSQCYRDCLFQICRLCAEECRARRLTLSALAFTSQRSSVLALDRDGQPLYPVLMWYDKRSAALCDGMDRKTLDNIYAICGLRLTPVLSAPKMLWFKQNEPELYRRTYKLAGIHDYLLFLCTGKFVTDISLASRTCLLDLRSGRWSKELLQLFDIDSDKLCSLIPCGSIAGHVTESFSQQTGLQKGLPVITAGGDQQCSLLGQGILHPGDMGITAGTAAYVTVLSRTPAADPARLLNTSIAAVDSHYVLEASNMSAASVYNWFRDTFYGAGESVAYVNAEVLQSPPGARGLLMQPDLTGAGCPYWDSAARGSFFNIGFHHIRADFARAVLEGICSEIADCFFTLESCCETIDTVISSGGLSHLPVFNQMLADMLSRPVTLCPQEETTGLGAFLNAAVTLEYYSDISRALAAVREQENPDSKTLTVFSPDTPAILLYQRQADARKYIRDSLSSQRLASYLNP